MKTVELAKIMGFSVRSGRLYLNGSLLIDDIEAEKIAQNYGYRRAEWFIRAMESWQ